MDDNGLVISGLNGGDTINGSEGNDTLHGYDGANSIFDDDNDTIHGGGGHDLLYGDGGNDLLYGGHDVFCPTDLSDTLRGGNGEDALYGNGGDDVLYGGHALVHSNDEADWIHGGAGNDSLYGNGGNDILYGGLGSDAVYGGQGNDTIYGGSDSVSSADAADTLYGGAGDDIIYGGNGADVIYGGEGNDTLYAGEGATTLTGGDGVDTFFIDDSTVITDPGNDETVSQRRVGFGQAGDEDVTIGANQRVVITDFDADDTLQINTGDKVITFNDLKITETVNTTTNTQVRIIELPDINAVIEVNLSGNAPPSNLSANNIVLNNNTTPTTPVEDEPTTPPTPPAPSSVLTANNTSFTQSYTEDATLGLNDLVIDATDATSNTITATLSLQNASHGALTTNTSSGSSGAAVTSTYNAGSGVWTATGHVDEVNELLADVAFVPAVDSDTNSSIAISVTGTDGASLTGSYTLNANAVNDAPVYGNQTFSVAENVANATSVGTAAATDVDTGDTLTYAITAGNGDGIFAIDANTGEITIADNTNLNFEGTNSYSLTVRATDDGTGTLSDTATVTVNVTDVNEAPSAISDSNAGANTLAENASNGAATGVTASSTDPDGGAITYSLTDNAGGRFAIDANTGVVTLADASLINHEDNASHTITVQADDGTHQTTENFTINVSDVNDAPTAVNISSGAVDENSSVGTDIGTLSTTDEDAGDSFTYSIVSDPDSKFTLTGNTLKVNGVLNHEIKSSHNVTIRSTDAAGATHDEILTINVSDINDAPIYANQTYSVAENTANSTVVGTPTASDEDSDAVTYSITAGNGDGVFAVDANTGQLTIADNTNLNYESGTTSYSLSIQASDGNGGTDTSLVTVNVTDVNDAPSVADQTFTVNEDAINSANVGSVSASDQENHNLTYAITGGNGDGIFAINATTGQITIADNTNLDYENDSSHALTVSVTDDGAGTPSSTATVTVNINDRNDAPVVNSSTFNVNENSANTTSVGTVTATDQDAGDTLTYSITAGNGDGMFAIDANTGEITIADNSNLNHELADSRTLTVRATDNGTGTLSATNTITVNVNDVNEAPEIANQTMNVLDTVSNGDAVGTVTASDPDDGDSITYSITAGDPTNIFTIDGNTGELTIADDSQITGGSGPFNLTIETEDASGLTTDATLTVTVNEVNDAPVLNDATVSIDENTANSTSVVDLNASDPENHALSYSITAGNGSGAFAINATTGEITVADSSALNYESGTTSYSLTVQTIETSTAETLSDTATITINLNDLNEAPTLNNATYSIDEDVSNSDSVGTNAASDPDAADTLTYSITSGNDDGIFAINANTGEITIADASQINYESGTTTYNLTTQVTDDGAGTLSDTASVTINVNNVNETPVNTVPANTSTNEDTSTTLSGFSVSDEDTGTSFNITLSVNNGDITLRDNVAGGINSGQISNNGTGTITLTGLSATQYNATMAAANALTYQPDANFNGVDTLTVTSSDGNTSDSDTVSITVNSVNDAPVEANPIDTQAFESDQTWTYTFANNLFSDAEGDGLTYTAQISSDAGTTFGALPGWLSFNAGTRTFDVSSAPGNPNVNYYTIRISADDGNGGVGTSDFAFNVTAVGLTAPDNTDQDMTGTPLADVIVGGDGDDRIQGLASNDTIFGGGGNDEIYGGGRTQTFGYPLTDDLIYGGDGNDRIWGDRSDQPGTVNKGVDTIYGGNGDDRIYGYTGDDLMYGDADNDWLYGGYDNDTAYGGSGNDWLFGDDNDDQLYGDAGADTLLGGSDNDTMTGGDGADQFRYDSLEHSPDTLTHDVITDFEHGVDVIRLPIFNAIVQGTGVASGRTLEWYQTGSGAGAKTIIRSDQIDYKFYLELEGHINLTAADFEFFGTVGTNGADNINGGGGVDAILALDGDDVIYSFDGNDQIWGGDGNDTVYASDGHDLIYGEDGDDVLYGGSAGDTIYGGAGNDTIYSDHAHTTQTSYVYGGAGADTFVFSFSHNQRELPWAAVIEDFEVGVDKIRIDGMPYNDVFVGGYDTDRSNEFRIFYDASDDVTYVQGNAYRGWFRTHIAVKGDYVNNVDPADNLSVSDFEFVNIITDNDGTDTDITANIIRESDDNKHEGLIGSNSGDTIFGSGGDEINAMDGDDVIIFKRGTNPNGNGGIHTGKGNDLVFGVSEYDRMYVNNLGGDNTLIGGNNTGIYMHRQNPGNDLVISLGRDMPFGKGDAGNDTMYGGRGGDYNFDGGGDNDFMHAGYGDDIDRFAGGSGDDTLIGGYGGDYIRGGNFNNDNGYGSDTFIIYDPMESTSTQTDVIFDFDTNDDQIILHGFTGIGPGATQVTITQYNATQHGYPGQNWTDITASGGDSGFKLTLKGHHNLTAGTDIIFNSAQLGSDSAETAADFTKTAGSDILFGMSNHDTMEGGAGDDSLYGGHSNDVLYGEADDDYLDGGYGDDTLDGGAGADELMGGYHDDVFVFDATSSTAANTDIIWDFKSANDGDKIDLSDASFGGIGYGDLTISTPGLDAANSSMYTVITEANTGFTLKLIGYFEDGFNLGASDFIF